MVMAGAIVGAKNPLISREIFSNCRGESMKVNRVIVIGQKFMSTQDDVRLAVHVWEDMFPSQRIKGCLLTAVECPIGASETDLLTAMKKGDWGLAVLGKYFKENILAGDKIEYLEFKKDDEQKIGLIVSISHTLPQRLVTCIACHKRTPVPTSDPPFGAPLRCVHCQSSLIRPSEPEEGSPLSTSSELLNKVYGYSDRYLDHPRCPWCGKTNYSIVFPEKGRSIGWYAEREPKNPQAFCVTVRCVHCDKDFYVEWDENPLQ
jgi:hypothetical protein